MKIRLADRSDLNCVSDLVVEFLGNTSYGIHTADNINLQYIRRLVFNILHVGYIWLLEDENNLVGLLAAVKEPNMWIPEKTSMRELIWYVKPEYRGTVSAGKLFIKFCAEGDALLAQGLIQGYFTTRMTTTADYDLESRGFRLTEKLYLKD
jgi:hypothetical protein